MSEPELTDTADREEYLNLSAGKNAERFPLYVRVKEAGRSPVVPALSWPPEIAQIHNRDKKVLIRASG